MKKNDLQPTPDNIRNTFIRDSIGRNKDLLYFIKIIDSIDESYSIALDSYWGSGKTFFVKQVKMILDANNEFTYDSVDNRDEVIEKWNSLLNGDIINTNYHIPIYYDAWENDNDNDPILSIIYQIIQTVGNYASIEEEKGLGHVFELAGDIFEQVKGFNPMEIAKKLKSDNPLESIIQAKSLQERINEFIESLIPEHGERLLIIIDELDRCNPEFAVKLLERIKHYFNNDKVTFVFSVNLSELQHTIKQHYGADFNAIRYMDRFFDLTINLPEPDITRYMLLQSLSQDSNYVYDTTISYAIKKFNMQLREISRYIPMARMAVDDYAYKDLNITKTKEFIIHIIVPVAMALMLTDKSRYQRFIDGKDASALTDFLNDVEIIVNLRYFLGLIFEDAAVPNLHLVTKEIDDISPLHERINEFYSAFFVKTGNIKICQCNIYDKDRDFLRRIMSLLSENVVNSIKKEKIGV